LVYKISVVVVVVVLLEEVVVVVKGHKAASIFCKHTVNVSFVSIPKQGRFAPVYIMLSLCFVISACGLEQGSQGRVPQHGFVGRK
jgi:hypothetical protein